MTVQEKNRPQFRSWLKLVVSFSRELKRENIQMNLASDEIKAAVQCDMYYVACTKKELFLK